MSGGAGRLHGVHLGQHGHGLGGIDRQVDGMIHGVLGLPMIGLVVGMGAMVIEVLRYKVIISFDLGDNLMYMIRITNLG